MHQPNRGVFVAEITADDLLGLLLPVRLAIESHAVPRAAARLEPAGTAELESVIDEMRAAAAAGDLAAVNDLDVRFHELTVQMSGSAQALQLWRSVQPRIRAQIYRLARRHADLDEIVVEHRQLLDAIQAGDPDILHQLLAEHIISSARQLLATPATPGPAEDLVRAAVLSPALASADPGDTQRPGTRRAQARCQHVSPVTRAGATGVPAGRSIDKRDIPSGS